MIVMGFLTENTKNEQELKTTLVTASTTEQITDSTTGFSSTSESTLPGI